MAPDDNTLLDLASHVSDMGEPVFGKYRGVVDDNKDPEKRGRLRLKIPTLLGREVTNWALPCLPFGGSSKIGNYWIPPKDARVWVEFEQGDIRYPIWTGTYWTGKVAPPAEDPAVHALQTPFGHKLIFDDSKNAEKITLSHATTGTPSVILDEKGRVNINDGKGAKVILDADAGKILVSDSNGNKITLSSAGISIEDRNSNSMVFEAAGITIKSKAITLDSKSISLGANAVDPVILGQQFLQLYMTHTHPTPAGPSLVPVPPSALSTLSKVVKTK